MNTKGRGCYYIFVPAQGSSRSQQRIRWLQKSPFRFRNRDEKKAAHEPRGSKRGRNGDFFPSYIKRLVSMRQQPGGVGEKQSADGVTQGQSRAAFLLRVTRLPHIARRGNWEPAPSVGSRAAGALIGHHGRARCFAPPRR